MTLSRKHRTAPFLATAACLALATAALPACAPLVKPVVEERGYIFEPDDLDKLQAGSSKEQVRTVMGSPSTVSTVDGEAWYYISSKFETYTFYQPKEVERTVAAVYFDKTDVVQQVAYYGLEDGQIVNFVDRKTRHAARNSPFSSSSSAISAVSTIRAAASRPSAPAIRHSAGKRTPDTTKKAPRIAPRGSVFGLSCLSAQAPRAAAGPRCS